MIKFIIWHQWAELKHVSVSFAQDKDLDSVSTQTHDGGDQPQVRPTRERPEQKAGDEYAKPGGSPAAHGPDTTDVHGDHDVPERWGNLERHILKQALARETPGIRVV